ncbi:MAG: PQQ-binding-like beta-propeller repeat protein [Gemmataceae bacterium]
MKNHFSLLATLFLAVALLSPLPGADWSGWRGPDRTGVSAEKDLLTTWPDGGPKLVWQSDKVGLGYSGLAVVGGVTYTMGAQGDDEFLYALDDKGAVKWEAKIGPVWDFDINQWSRGPNATPTVDGDRVYALSSKGALLCANRENGKPLWTLDVAREMEGEVNPVGGPNNKFGWGYSWSPLVDGDQLILAPGGPKGLLAAVDKKSGKPLWRSKGVPDKATYSSPVVATLGGTRQYVYLTQDGVVGIAAKDGELLWRYKRESDYPDVVCPTPIVTGNQVYVSVGYSAGADLLEVTGSGAKFEVKAVWSEKVIGNKQGGVIQVGKHVYGFHEDNVWVCQDLVTGKMAWPKTIRARQPFKAGSGLVADGRFYLVDEQGKVGMFEASPKGFKAAGEFKLPAESKKRKVRGGLWTGPSLSDGKLYIRDQELVFCYQVK